MIDSTNDEAPHDVDSKKLARLRAAQDAGLRIQIRTMPWHSWQTACGAVSFDFDAECYRIHPDDEATTPTP